MDIKLSVGVTFPLVKKGTVLMICIREKSVMSQGIVQVNIVKYYDAEKGLRES